MKKVVVMLCTMVMIIGSVFSVYAQPSVDIDGVVTIINAVDRDGNEVEIKFRDLGDEHKTLVANALKKDELKELLGDDYSKYLTAIQKSEAYVWDAEEGEITGKDAGKLFPVTLTLSVPGATSEKTVILLQYVDGKWNKVLGVVREDDTVEVKIAGVGPTVVLVENVEQTEGPNQNIVSPQTGNSGIIINCTALAILALAVAAVAAKKSRA